MKRKAINKNGSTMILLVFAIAIMSILGTSILSVTMMNYRIKKTNTEIKKSFYLSELGLDNSYSNAYKLVVKAVDESNNEAKEFIDQFTCQNIELWKNTKYMDFNEDIEGNKIYFYLEDIIQEDAKEEFKNKYKNIIENAASGIISVVESVSFHKPEENKKLIVDVKNKNQALFNVDGNMIVKINSTYFSDKNIMKSTSVDFILKIPEYNGSYTVETRNIPVNPFWTKVLTANSLEIKGETEFWGNVYVSGDVEVVNSITATFKNNLTAKEDIKLIGDSPKAVVNDVYAKSIYLENTSAKIMCETVNDKIYLKNNLETGGVDFSYIDVDLSDEATKIYNIQTEKLGFEKNCAGNLLEDLTFVNQVKLSSLSVNKIEESDKLNYIYLNKDGGTLYLEPGIYKGLIVTNGHINISDGVDFKGSIICGGKVTLEGENNIFSYDKNIATKIIAENDIHKSIFKESVSVEEVRMTILSTNCSEEGYLDFSNLLKLRNWKMN